MADAVGYADTPEGWVARWAAEFAKARDAVKDWHVSAEKCTDRYLDEETRTGERLNLYSANINTQEAMLYGQTPRVDVSRKFNDAADDVGRLAAELLQRCLNGDIERAGDGYAAALRASLNDYLIAGFLGGMRFRLTQKKQPTAEVPAILGPDGAEQAPAIPAGEKIVEEDVETDYFHWKDQIWSPCRIFSDCRWWAFRTLMGRSSVESTFGKVDIPFAMKTSGGDKAPPSPWDRAEVWEIWDKEHKCAWWYVEGAAAVLAPLAAQPASNGSVPDPLGIKGFWPFPEPRMTNVTTRRFVPRPDFAIAQDSYNAVDDETTRIAVLRDVLKAACVYDKTVPEFQTLLTGKGNKFVPADSFAQLSEKGGLAQAVAWLPLDAFVAALDKLRELRQEDMGLLFQVTGFSDIMRGQATASGATATEQAIKAKFSGVRAQSRQDIVAAYASDGQRVRGEIIAKHFSPQTIAQHANASGMPKQDQQFVEQALALLPSDFACYRIIVKPEAISLTDYAANKQESMDVLGAIGAFLQAIGPLAQQAPQAAPIMLQLLQVFLARVKGGDAVEGILDQFIEMAEQAAQAAANAPPQPDPHLEAQKVRADAEKFKAGADIQSTKLDMAANQQKHQQEMQKLGAEASVQQMEHAAQRDGLAAIQGLRPA